MEEKTVSSSHKKTYSSSSSNYLCPEDIIYIACVEHSDTDRTHDDAKFSISSYNIRSRFLLWLGSCRNGRGHYLLSRDCLTCTHTKFIARATVATFQQVFACSINSGILRKPHAAIPPQRNVTAEAAPTISDVLRGSWFCRSRVLRLSVGIEGKLYILTVDFISI